MEAVWTFFHPCSRLARPFSHEILVDCEFVVFVEGFAARTCGWRLAVFDPVNQTTQPTLNTISQSPFFTKSLRHFTKYPDRENDRKKNKQVEEEEPRQFDANHSVGRR
jgi:hypothetical protein